MTPEQIAAARAAMVVSVKAQLGLTGIDPSTWSNDQRQAYLQALAFYINSNPGNFTAGENTLAQNVASAGAIALENTSFAADAGVFADALGSQVKAVVLDPLANIGNGFSKAITWIGNLLPWVVVAYALYWVLKAKKELDSSK